MAFPDAVALTIAYLTPIVTPATVVSDVPDPRPDRLVQVRRVGGPALPPVRDRARLDIWTWDSSAPAAMALALQVRAALWALSGKTTLGVVVYQVQEFMGPRQDDDSETGVPRVWATYSLTIRANDVIQPAPTI